MSVVDLSKNLFILPKVKILAVFYATIAIISLFISFQAFLFLIILTATIFCSIPLLRLRFNLRRVLFLSILVSTLSLLSFVVSGIFAGSFFLFLAVMHFCSERGFIPSTFVSAIPFLALQPSSIFALLLSAFLFYIYLRFMNVRIGNSSMREFVESFVKFWLTNEPRYAEEILIKNSDIFEGRVKCLRLNDFKLISTDFHPGPFRNVGGAKLVDLLESPNSVYLHSPSSHDRNPVSEEDLIRIRDALRCEGVELAPMKPFELESENFRVFCFPFDKIKLIFVSGKRRLDDFILDSKNFVVDCHNANFFGDLETEEVREIETVVRKAENIISEPLSAVKGSFLKISAETESISKYISAILLDYGFSKYAIIVFNSNNIDPDFRELVERRFRELGFRAIVCSTDNHSKTGLKVKESYKPAGGCKDDFEFLEKLVEKTKTVEFETLSLRYGESLVRVRILGSVREKIENLAGRAGKYIYLFFILIFLSWLISVIISKVI
ncbi:MAG: DUF2070 family protein [Archaeoglobaceae archaeon]|nr:DUF2070 family protein [Archaeoglobaceae archaeon]MDW8117658.1 DUF2070 family protein [Archaeoglobaceae archaeon]